MLNQGNIIHSEPYAPRDEYVGKLVGRDQELRLIAASWMGGQNCLPLSPMLVGDPGLGKNRLIYEIAKRCNKDLYIFQGHEDVTAEDLVCTVRFSDDPDRKIDYVLSPLATAMLKGGICFIDEIAKIRPRALALLSSTLDDRRYVDSTLLGRRIHAKPAFRFIAATNTTDFDSNPMPDFIGSRLRPVVNFGYPPTEEINLIIEESFPRLEKNSKSLLDTFWSEWTKYNESRAPAPRDAIYLFMLASSFADFDNNDDSIPVHVTADHLKEAFCEINSRDAKWLDD